MSKTLIPANPASSTFYRAAWRWHFYAGLYVVPFLLMLAITGLIMVYSNSIETRFGAKHYVAAEGEVQPVADQAKSAEAAIPGGKVIMYVAPFTPDRSSIFAIESNGIQNVVAVDPHSAKVLGSLVKDGTWFYWVNKIHGTFLLGAFGDRLIEIAAGLGIVLVISGLYLRWPRDGKTLFRVRVPNLTTRGRALWKELHAATGFCISIVLFFFLLTGMSWTGIWGEKLVQAWSTFPAEKWDNVPLSDKTHANMNHGALHEVPWGMEQTKLPLSGSQAGITGTPEDAPVNLDSVATLAHQIGFANQFRINLPKDQGGVYTISADSMDGDTENPWSDRTIHVDQYTGKILAEVRFADYSLGAKSMAVGTALHQGDLGLWNTILNTLFCLAIIFLTLSGMVMWWLRRPKDVFRIVPPPMPENLPLWRGAVLTMLIVSLTFPLMGLTLISLLAFDILILSRVPFLRTVFK